MTRPQRGESINDARRALGYPESDGRTFDETCPKFDAWWAQHGFGQAEEETTR